MHVAPQRVIPAGHASVVGVLVVVVVVVGVAIVVVGTVMVLLVVGATVTVVVGVAGIVVVVARTVVVVLVVASLGPSGAQIMRATVGVAPRVPNSSSRTIGGSTVRGHRTL